jgi:hypothetical protein
LAESRAVKRKEHPPWLNTLHRHSLLIFIIVTGIGWTILFLRMNVDSKWGQMMGNIVSEWVQMAGLVFLTKRLVEEDGERLSENAEALSDMDDNHWGNRRLTPTRR